MTRILVAIFGCNLVAKLLFLMSSNNKGSQENTRRKRPQTLANTRKIPRTVEALGTSFWQRVKDSNIPKNPQNPCGSKAVQKWLQFWLQLLLDDVLIIERGLVRHSVLIVQPSASQINVKFQFIHVPFFENGTIIGVQCV